MMPVSLFADSGKESIVLPDAQGYQFNEEELRKANELVQNAKLFGKELSVYDFIVNSADNSKDMFLPEELKDIPWDGGGDVDDSDEIMPMAAYLGSTISKYGQILKGIK